MIVIGTTLTTFAMSDEDAWSSWLHNAEALAADAHANDHDVRIFVAIEIDRRGIGLFEPLLQRMREIGEHCTNVDVEHWTYMLDDGRTTVSTANRLRHITVGQNLVTDYAVSAHADWLLFLAADLRPDLHTFTKLLDMRWPYVGGEVATYCLDGPRVERHPDTGQAFGFEVASHMPTAAYVMLRRDVFRRLRWRWDYEDGSDDPCLYRDAKEHLGIGALVRKDCIGVHYPVSVPAIEQRGYDMTVERLGDEMLDG